MVYITIAWLGLWETDGSRVVMATAGTHTGANKASPTASDDTRQTHPKTEPPVLQIQNFFLAISPDLSKNVEAANCVHFVSAKVFKKPPGLSQGFGGVFPFRELPRKERPAE